jgi:hypothetical protein
VEEEEEEEETRREFAQTMDSLGLGCVAVEWTRIGPDVVWFVAGARVHQTMRRTKPLTKRVRLVRMVRMVVATMLAMVIVIVTWTAMP